MIEVKIIKDSLSPSDIRLTTFLLTYPRFIHSEFLTHRMLSKNSSSSRAIPVNKQIQMVIDNPAIPLAFTKNKSGMQGGEPLIGEEAEKAKFHWLQARDEAVKSARLLLQDGVHKQYSNRIIEPYSYITVVCSGTDFANFFALRYHPMAQPEICELAKQMYELYKTQKPNPLKYGQWHLPFITEDDILHVLNDVGNEEGQDAGEVMIQYLIKLSVARCARTSYLTHDRKNPSISDDLALYDRLIGQLPIHASPAEHQAMAMNGKNFRSGNFRGWLQYRKTLANENIKKFEGPSDY